MNSQVALTDVARWQVMWGSACLFFVGLKLLAWSTRRPELAVCWRHLAFLIAWPGMDANAFLFGVQTDACPPPSYSEWLFALGKTFVGLAILLVVVPLAPSELPWLVGWTGMLGLIMFLHFGLFHLLACYWRSFGIVAKPIMNWPVLSISLSEFWGQRWNLAFRDLTHRFLFRPLSRRYGPLAALLLSFGLSGLIHECVISLPAGGGYGFPFCYFMLQGAGIAIEKSPWGKSIGFAAGQSGRLFTYLLLVLPITWLFHRYFVVDVIVPFLQALGATR